MYGIAITVAACLQAGTKADVAWLVGADGIPVSDWSDAVVFTPGGGHVGSLLGGALDASVGAKSVTDTFFQPTQRFELGER